MHHLRSRPWGCRAAVRWREDGGFSTAELLGNAALGILALVVIWGMLRTLGVDVVELISAELLQGG